MSDTYTAPNRIRPRLDQLDVLAKNELNSETVEYLFLRDDERRRAANCLRNEAKKLREHGLSYDASPTEAAGYFREASKNMNLAHKLDPERK